MLVCLSRTVSDIFTVKCRRDLEIWARSPSRSLKMVPFESLGTVSMRFIVTMARVSLLFENGDQPFR